MEALRLPFVFVSLPTCAALLVVFLSHSCLLVPFCSTRCQLWDVNFCFLLRFRSSLKLREEEGVEHIVSFICLSSLIHVNIYLCTSVSPSLFSWLSVPLLCPDAFCPFHRLFLPSYGSHCDWCRCRCADGPVLYPPVFCRACLGSNSPRPMLPRAVLVQAELPHTLNLRCCVHVCAHTDPTHTPALLPPSYWCLLASQRGSQSTTL